MHTRLLAVSLAMTAALLGIFPMMASAQLPSSGSPPPTTTQPAPSTTVKLRPPTGDATIPELIGRIVNAFLGLVGSLAFLMFIWGGFNWLISAGSPEKVEKGKKAMIYASIGILIVFSSYALVKFVLGAFDGSTSP